MIVIVDLDKKETHNYPLEPATQKAMANVLDKYVEYINEDKGKINLSTLYRRRDVMIVSAERVKA